MTLSRSRTSFFQHGEELVRVEETYPDGRVRAQVVFDKGFITKKATWRYYTPEQVARFRIPRKRVLKQYEKQIGVSP